MMQVFEIRNLKKDEFHPKENIEKMTKGIPLTDIDRLPWLQALHKQVRIIANSK